MLKEMLSEGSKTSSKRVILFLLFLMVFLSHFSEQWFGFKVDFEKYNSLIGLTKIVVLAVLGDKAASIVSAFRKKEDEKEA